MLLFNQFQLLIGSTSLAHPNVKLFITHGGLLSTFETIYHGIPIVAIPIFGDQKMNTAKAVKQGYATVVPFQKLTEDSLEKAIKEVLSNPRWVLKWFYCNVVSLYLSYRYRDIAKKKSRILRDQLVPPLQRAMFWIEYVLRHGHCDHLRSAALELSWYQYFLLDVVAVVLLVLVVLFVLINSAVKMSFRREKTKKSEKEDWELKLHFVTLFMFVLSAMCQNNNSAHQQQYYLDVSIWSLVLTHI